jgi:hypothetical protein
MAPLTTLTLIMSAAALFLALLTFNMCVIGMPAVFALGSCGFVAFVGAITTIMVVS